MMTSSNVILMMTSDGDWHHHFKINNKFCHLYHHMFSLKKFIFGIKRSNMTIDVMDVWDLDRTTSVPKSVLRYDLDKVRSLDLETSLSQYVCVCVYVYVCVCFLEGVCLGGCVSWRVYR